MGQHKKSRAGKGRAGRMPRTPMMRETCDEIAMRLHADVETLIHCPTEDAYNMVSRNLQTFDRTYGRHDEIERIKQAMHEICARYIRVKRIGVSADEASALRGGASFMAKVLHVVSVQEWLEADLKTVYQVNSAVYHPYALSTAQGAA